MDYSISQFTVESYDDVYLLWQQTEGIGLTDCDTKEGISDYLLRNPAMSFIAKVDGKVVGAILSGHDGRRGYVHHLAVRKDFRKQSVGKQLVEKCITALKNAGIKKCHIFIFNNNTDGINFWNAVGWKQRSDISIISKDMP
jgi:putative acetyltransferase